MATPLKTGEVVPFPGGDNATDVIINDMHFNLTALQHFNYTLWSNGTLSNVSRCFLVLEGYRPSMFANGTFVNGTSCYDPYFNVRTRGAVGIVFACLFGASIVVSLVNLRKHGRLFLPSEKRFRAIGRRWPWYWLLYVATCGTISGFTAIDVDRAYLQGLSIILQNFFFFMMIPGVLAAIWESVRHWWVLIFFTGSQASRESMMMDSINRGSWQERQIYDRDHFLLPHDDTRSKKEFYMPLTFYFFAFMVSAHTSRPRICVSLETLNSMQNFFMTIPRSWTKIQHQRSLEQQSASAAPIMTDGRFKAASIFAFLAWCVICYSLRHSIHYYKPRNRGLWNRFIGFFHWAPTKFMLVIPMALVMIGYSAAIAFEWTINPLRYDALPGWIYGLGHAPIILIISVFEIYGYIDENEDRLILKQRRELGRSNDAELGIDGAVVKKPGWWSKRHGTPGQDAPMEMTGGERPGRLSSINYNDGQDPRGDRNVGPSTEIPPLPNPRPATTTTPVPRAAAYSDNDDPRGNRDVSNSRRDGSTASNGSSNQSISGPAVRIRSMLDV